MAQQAGRFFSLKEDYQGLEARVESRIDTRFDEMKKEIKEEVKEGFLPIIALLERAIREPLPLRREGQQAVEDRDRRGSRGGEEGREGIGDILEDRGGERGL
jgi:hypothetical protein